MSLRFYNRIASQGIEYEIAQLACSFVVDSACGRNGERSQGKVPVPADEPSTPEAIKQFNEDKVAELSKQIAGKEDQPAEAVFKNIKNLDRGTTGDVLKIMQMGCDRALSTSCAHCHVPGRSIRTKRGPS